MTDYREIIRLEHQGVSGRDIANSCGCSRNTVARILGKAREHGVLWPKAEAMTNGDLRDIFFPGVVVPFSRTRPDCEHIHKEMVVWGCRILTTLYKFSAPDVLN